MNEHDLRNAFDHLKSDVAANVQTEDRLEDITGSRRTRVRPAIAAFAGAAAAVVLVGGAIWAVRANPTSDTVPPATAGPTPTKAIDTTAAPTTTSPSTTAAAGLPELPQGTVVVADMDVVAFEENEDHVAYLAERVTGDGSGGIVFQIDQRLIHFASSGEGEDIVNARDVVADIGPVSMRLEDIAYVDGSPRVIYSYIIGSGFDVYEEVWSYDLATGTSELLLRQDGEGYYEHTITRVSLASDLMVLTMSAPGTTYFEFYDGDGQWLDVPGPVIGARGFTDFDKPVEDGVLAPDGSKLAYLQHRDITTGEDGYYIVDIVVWDLVNEVQLQRVELELREGESPATPGRLDYDGVGIVLGLYRNLVDGPAALQPLWIESLADGTVTRIGTPGTPSLIK